MNYPIQTLIRMGLVPPVTFPTDSRYYGFGTLIYTAPGGQSITYLQPRTVPQSGAKNYATIAQHTVVSGDRLDLIAAKYLGDPIMFWLICDANGAIKPESLIEKPGTVINITMPQGVPGGPSAA